ncbi:SRPBCC family protein [Gordonia McavH-238-E]|uniref:SRPBCC family protein n=1 Tax=Gordonia sp. McavH-238-E TaxID=2917736 RepID=UPI001EF4ED5A|nr:SRPBCC family protein [Gordonia sp. McavH-238-E]MCG7630918.1 SRPBCC family protein [Gordonia sp. McavH-238-E]
MRQELTSDSVSRHIDATPEELYDIVADVTRTPELSAEIAHVEWLDGATGPAVGARFRARNSAGRGPDWHNEPVVTVADRGREFTFERTEKIAGTLRWRYRFEPEAGGTRVTESYEVTRPLSLLGWFVIGPLYGLPDRKSDLRAGMIDTLERLATVVHRQRV